MTSRPARPRGRLRVGDVLALAGRPGRAAGRVRPVGRHAAPRPRRGGTRPAIDVPLVQADAQYLPFRDAPFDIAFTAFGAVPFVADSARVMREVARVLRPGGRWVFATTHPTRWAFPDDPGPDGLTRDHAVLGPHALRRVRRGRRADLRRAPPHAGRAGAGDRRRRASGWSTSSSRNGRPGTPRSGASGHRCAARSCPAPRSTSASCRPAAAPRLVVGIALGRAVVGPRGVAAVRATAVAARPAAAAQQQDADDEDDHAEDAGDQRTPHLRQLSWSILSFA